MWNFPSLPFLQSSAPKKNKRSGRRAHRPRAVRMILRKNSSSTRTRFRKSRRRETLSAPFEWTPFSIDLSAYAGQTVQIAIQCVSSDAFIFMIDDIRISKPDVGLQASVFGDVSIYPNPAKESCQIQGSNIFTGIEVADMSGRIVYRNMNLATGNFLLHVDNWNSGLYLIKLYKKEENAVFKLIVR